LPYFTGGIGSALVSVADSFKETHEGSPVMTIVPVRTVIPIVGHPQDKHHDARPSASKEVGLQNSYFNLEAQPGDTSGKSKGKKGVVKVQTGNHKLCLSGIKRSGREIGVHKTNSESDTKQGVSEMPQQLAKTTLTSIVLPNV